MMHEDSFWRGLLITFLATTPQFLGLLVLYLLLSEALRSSAQWWSGESSAAATASQPSAKHAAFVRVTPRPAPAFRQSRASPAA